MITEQLDEGVLNTSTSALQHNYVPACLVQTNALDHQKDVTEARGESACLSFWMFQRLGQDSHVS